MKYFYYKFPVYTVNLLSLQSLIFSRTLKEFYLTIQKLSNILFVEYEEKLDERENEYCVFQESLL